MNIIDRLRLFSDGQTSAHDARALLMSMGHTQEEFAEAFADLAAQAGSSIRISKVTMGEMQADIFLRVDNG